MDANSSPGTDGATFLLAKVSVSLSEVRFFLGGGLTNIKDQLSRFYA